MMLRVMMMRMLLRMMMTRMMIMRRRMITIILPERHSSGVLGLLCRNQFFSDFFSLLMKN